jgi:hypothetical protein
MPDTRLDLIDPVLSGRLQQLSARQLRHITYTICTLALERTGVRDPVIAAAMDIVKTGRYDDVSRREQLDILVERLDAQQWDLQDAVAAGHADEGAYLLAFAQARAAHAVYFALDADPFIAATEAIYEAQAAIDEIDVIRAAISTALV